MNLSADELQADGVHLSAADSQQNRVRRRGAEVQTDRDVRAHVIALFHCGESETAVVGISVRRRTWNRVYR